jgi:hypothetical protein
MRWFSRTNTFLVALLILLFFSCGKDLTPCECGRNLSKSFDEIDQDLEVKCEDYLLDLSKEQRNNWNKEVLNCTSEK